MADDPSIEEDSGVTNAQFKSFLSKASIEELEQARADNKRAGNEALWFDYKRLARQYSIRAHQCKTTINDKRANPGDKGEQQ